jgi:hypothetical protein
METVAGKALGQCSIKYEMCGPSCCFIEKIKISCVMAVRRDTGNAKGAKVREKAVRFNNYA